MKTLKECKYLLRVLFESQQRNDRSDMALAYRKLDRASQKLPPCNVVNSLHDDILNYRLQNLSCDLNTISDVVYKKDSFDKGKRLY